MILHVDMDCFFAQAEEERQPFYRGKTVIVCVYSRAAGDSGVVSTVNYEGRKYGIHSGMPIYEAKKRAPQDSVFLPVDRPYYEDVSARIDAIVRKYSGKVEKTSIDEWFLEVEKSPEEAANALKKEIRDKTGMKCTIGSAPSRTGAKMATDKAKPDGILILDIPSERKMIDESPVEKVPGIGKRTAEALNAINAKKVADIAGIGPTVLVDTFGRKTGAWLACLGRGEYADGIGEESEQAEISRMGTLEKKTNDPYMIMLKVKELEKEPKEWLRERKKFYKTVTLIFITDDMKTHSKSLTFRKPKEWSEDITDGQDMVVNGFLKGNDRNVRRVGIRFSNLLDTSGQTRLF